MDENAQQNTSFEQWIDYYRGLPIKLLQIQYYIQEHSSLSVQATITFYHHEFFFDWKSLLVISFQNEFSTGYQVVTRLVKLFKCRFK